jgi:2-polyprenyl-3-methyl-5-hydroxy-6-metoxy-1,4-benzoquinol methylase
MKMEEPALDYWKTYDQAYRTTNPDMGSAAYDGADYSFLKPHLPSDRSVAMLDLGCGAGFLLYWLRKQGYSDLEGTDISPGQAEAARRALVGAARIHLGEASAFLAGKSARYGRIFLFDVIEHVKKEELGNFLAPIIGGLKPGGSLVVRTPNMASPFGAYSRYLDITHELGFTEQSLHQVMLAAGAKGSAIIDQNAASSWKSRLYVRCRNAALRRWFRLEQRTIPTVFDKNICIAYTF